MTIAGFGGNDQGIKNWSLLNKNHNLETDYRLIDILIDAGKIKNIEGSHIYR